MTILRSKSRIAVMVSDVGTGTNLAAIISGVRSGRINGDIVAVISDRADAPALEHARKYSLNIEICTMKEDLLPIMRRLELDYVCLAGWKQIIPNEVIVAFPNKILNLHPGLIPDDFDGVVKNPDGTDGLWNRGMLSEKAIRNFLNEKATYAGSTIHALTLNFDFGPILGRTFEKIEDSDTIESLYARLKKKENELYIEVLERLTKPEEFIHTTS